MKYIHSSKIASAVLFCFLSTVSIISKGQSTDTVVTHRAKNLYAEFGGAGVTISVNYDTRFFNTRDGLGIRAGAGYYDNIGPCFSIPLQLNYLIGKKNHFAEIAAGGSYIGFKGGNAAFFPNARYYTTPPPPVYKHTFIGSGTLGYRYQPHKGGLNFRANVSICFNRAQVQYIPGISAGYTFK